MKKKYLIFFLSLIIISTNVKAEEKYKDVTEDIEVRYKWYKEIKTGEGEYYPLRKITEEDRYDKYDFKYVNTTRVNEEFCSYPTEFYKIEPKKYQTYTKVNDARYVVIENIKPETLVKIYYKNNDFNYRIVSHENNILILDLKVDLLCDKLLFYVDTLNKYKISLYRDVELKKLIMSKELENEKFSIPNTDWKIEPNAYYETYISTIKYDESSLTKLKEEKTMCGCSEKYVYKYNVTREYYDDNYYEYIEGYIKDENDYRYYYKGEPIIVNNTIEVVKEKIKEVPKIEYIYLEKESQEAEKEEKKECVPVTNTKIETKIIEKEITKQPKKIYMVIIGLYLLVMALIIKDIVKKCRRN